MLCSNVLGDLYGASMDRPRLASALDRLRTQTGARSVTIHWFHRTPDRLRHRWLATCSATPAPAGELSLLDDLNPRTIVAVNPVHDGVYMLEDDNCPDALQGQFHQWQARLREQGLGQFLGARIAMGALGEAGLAVHAGVGTPLAAHCRQTLTDLMPHVREALRLMIETDRRADENAMLRHVMDRIQFALAICDDAGRVQIANPAARGLLEGLVVRLPGMADGEWRLIEGLRPLLLSGSPGAMRWRNGDREVLLHAVALPRFALERYAIARERRAFALALADAGGPPPPSPADLRAFFALTPSEADLLARLCGGDDVATFAQARGVSIHTARTQLKQVMAKTRASRQADLIRLALASPSHLFGRSN